MKKIMSIAVLLFITVVYSNAQIDYNDYFTPDRLRMDLVFAGNANEQHVYLDGLHFEKEWSGSVHSLIPDFDYGEYAIEVYSADDGMKIFMKGFCSLFSEWRTTKEAEETDMAQSNSIWIPFPKNKIKVVVSERMHDTGALNPIFSCNIDPADKSIKRDVENNYKIDSVLYNGASSQKVDLVFVAEGYTAQEMAKFRLDVNEFMGYLFDIEPYKSRKEGFNIWAVESVSVDSGTDIPHHDIWKNTVACSNFYTFKTDRYLTAPDQKKVVQIVSNTPCDAIYVIVNFDKYGGGGIYNYYGLSMSDHKYEAEVFVHEFGHSFAGLGDEYYSSEVAYEDMYNPNVEPWEPNLTTLADFGRKWKDKIDKTTPVPTPDKVEYSGLVGLFEGGGYSAKGVYRPVLDCRMKTNTAAGFCPICIDAINRMIDYYCK
mgnify:CR=1 FL=1